MSQTAPIDNETTSDAAPNAPATVCPATSGKLLARDGEQLTLGLPGTDYRIELQLDGLLNAAVGDKITGTIHAQAQRIDRITGGGRYVEPVFGRPRRVQGVVIGGDPKAGPRGAIFVSAGGATLSCELTDARQSLADFHLQQMVTFDVKRGAAFRPM